MCVSRAVEFMFQTLGLFGAVLPCKEFRSSEHKRSLTDWNVGIKKQRQRKCLSYFRRVDRSVIIYAMIKKLEHKKQVGP